MAVWVSRGIFILLTAFVLAFYAWRLQDRHEDAFLPMMLFVIVGAAGVGGGVLLDILKRQKNLSTLMGVLLGLATGLLSAYALSFVVDLVGRPWISDNSADAILAKDVLDATKILIGVIACYWGISLVLQSKDDWRFVIPYVELAKQIRGDKPTLLDTSVIIDGRIVDICETLVVQGVLIVPKFVLHELQAIADSKEKTRRARGRRGLDVLLKLQESTAVEVRIEDTTVEGHNVDQMLITLAQQMPARVMTNDYNLNKIAGVRGVQVVNLNDLAKAMRPTVLPGEMVRVRILRPGESVKQGVGYMEDGTMVVVENARHRVGQEVDLEITSTLQTSAGRMIFGKASASLEDRSDALDVDDANDDEVRDVQRHLQPVVKSTSKIVPPPSEPAASDGRTNSG